MKIGVESSAIFRKQKTGVGYYCHNLTQALIQQMPNDTFILCYISFITKQPEKLNPSPSNVLYRRISLLPGKIYNFLDHYIVGLPIDILARTKADVFIFPNFFHWPLWLTKTSVVVVHDLAFLDTPEHVVPRHRKYLARRVPQSVARATHVLTVSSYTKQQLIKNYGTNPDKITVIEPAIEHSKYHVTSDMEITRTKEKYKITREYFLYLGTIEPRKNIVGIVGAYKLLPEEVRQRYQLVLAGGKGWLDLEINSSIASLPPESVVRTGYVADGDEPALYTGASLFLYPSHYEGWGMQILESMACGTPVIAAHNSSLVEVGGSAAYFLQNNNGPTLCNAILDLLSDPKKQEKMRQSGFVHAGTFTWEKSAKKLAELLRSLVKDKQQ